MSDFDLDRLGDVWRQQPDPAEMERLRRTAIAVARRARVAAILDVLTALAVAGVVIVLVLANPKVQTFVMGSAAILVLLGSNLRQRKLRQVELKQLTGTTEEMLRQSIDRIETTLRHHKFTLYGIAPLFLATYIFAKIVAPNPGSLLGGLRETPWFRPITFGAGVAAVVALAIFLILSIRRGRRELNRLNVMRDAYSLERDSSAP
jgi:hypothetical protein